MGGLSVNPLRSALSALAGLLLCTVTANAQTGACASDLNGDGIVAGADLALVLGSWGPCKTCDGDVNGDHVVDGVDLAFVLTRWGGTCAPTVLFVSPSHGSTSGGTSITITGSGLLAASSVTLAGVPCTEVTALSANQLRAVTPASAPGLAPLVVYTPAGSAEAAAPFSYVVQRVTSITPSSGLVAGGTQITISGEFLSGTTSVTVGGAPVANLVVVNSSTLTATTPPGAVGPAPIVITGAKGTLTVPTGFQYVSVIVPAWATLLEPAPDPGIVTNPALRAAILATGRPWRVRDNSTQAEMVLVPPGSFNMGCSPSSSWGCDPDESPVHQIALTNALYLGRCEVTQAQWTAIMGSNPSLFQGVNWPNSAARPVERVSLSAVRSFLTATGCRLPTEAEWECACRAGTSTAFHGCSAFPDGTNDDTLAAAIAWTSSNSNNQTQPVGQKLPNGFGLYDMQGNVYEWINDFYSASYYAVSPSVDPLGPSSGGSYVTRGGVFVADSGYARCSNRTNSISGNTAYTIGFRVARNP